MRQGSREDSGRSETSSSRSSLSRRNTPPLEQYEKMLPDDHEDILA